MTGVQVVFFLSLGCRVHRKDTCVAGISQYMQKSNHMQVFKAWLYYLFVIKCTCRFFPNNLWMLEGSLTKPCVTEAFEIGFTTTASNHLPTRWKLQFFSIPTLVVAKVFPAKCDQDTKHMKSKLKISMAIIIMSLQRILLVIIIMQ